MLSEAKHLVVSLMQHEILRGDAPFDKYTSAPLW
jgi:hypothetical protein